MPTPSGPRTRMTRPLSHGTDAQHGRHANGTMSDSQRGVFRLISSWYVDRHLNEITIADTVRKRSRLRGLWAALAGIVCISTLALADSPPLPINISAGELVTALETLAKQTAVELVFQPEQLKSF